MDRHRALEALRVSAGERPTGRWFNTQAPPARGLVAAPGRPRSRWSRLAGDQATAFGFCPIADSFLSTRPLALAVAHRLIGRFCPQEALRAR